MPRQPRDLTGRFVPTRDGRQQGNFEPKEGDTAGNMMGLAEMAHVLSEAIEALIQPGISGAVAIGNYFDWVYTKYDGKQGNEQPATPVFGSRIKSTAKSNRVSRNFDDTPIPFNMQRSQNGAGGNKRRQDDTRDSDEDDDFSRLIKVRAVANEAAAAAAAAPSRRTARCLYQVFWLISADQAILFGDETCAAALSIGLKQFQKAAKRAKAAAYKVTDETRMIVARQPADESELYTVAMPVPIGASLNGRFWFPYATNDGVEAAQTLSIGIQKGHSWQRYRAAATAGQNNGGEGNENEEGGGDGA
ncbi:hypothetical protein NCS52_00064100 [Fusarium sp. LHS14.1]|nr:hypothetical protein NCS52_00064100 [Fusarium sp. LHS14.1]